MTTLDKSLYHMLILLLACSVELRARILGVKTYIFFLNRSTHAYTAITEAWRICTNAPEEVKNRVLFFFFFTRVLQNSLYISTYMRYVHLRHWQTVSFVFSLKHIKFNGNHVTRTITPGNAPKELGFYTQRYIFVYDTTDKRVYSIHFFSCWSVVVQYGYKHSHGSQATKVWLIKEGGVQVWEIGGESNGWKEAGLLRLVLECKEVTTSVLSDAATSTNAWSTWFGKLNTGGLHAQKSGRGGENACGVKAIHTTTSADAATFPSGWPQASFWRLHIHTHIARLFKCGRLMRSGRKKKRVGIGTREVGGWNAQHWPASPDSTPSLHT